MKTLEIILAAIESEMPAKSCDALKRETKLRLAANVIDAPEYLVDALCVAVWNDELRDEEADEE